MDARTTTPMRLLAAIALTLGAWFVAPAVRAEARPAQVVVEYGTTLEAGAKAADQGNALAWLRKLRQRRRTDRRSQRRVDRSVDVHDRIAPRRGDDMAKPGRREGQILWIQR